jgi:hypothetical protein
MTFAADKFLNSASQGFNHFTNVLFGWAMPDFGDEEFK